MYVQQKSLVCEGPSEAVASSTDVNPTVWRWFGQQEHAKSSMLKNLEISGGCNVKWPNLARNFVVTYNLTTFKLVGGSVTSFAALNITSESMHLINANLQLYSENSFKFGSMVMDQLSTFVSYGNLVLQGDILLAGSITLKGFASLTLEARVINTVFGAGLTADTMTIKAHDVTFSGSLLATKVYSENCSSAEVDPSVIVNASNKVTVADSALVKGSRIFINGSYIQIFGNIDASGMGCPAGKGLGVGGSCPHGEFCGTGGGGHAGNGGDGTTAGGQNYTMGSGTAGSGSGRISNQTNLGIAGMGGGVVIINGETILLSGSINANGFHGEHLDTSYYGGGAGGSILLSADSVSIASSQVTKPLVTATGGASSIGPAGGGGGGYVLLSMPLGVIVPFIVTTNIVDVQGGVHQGFQGNPGGDGKILRQPPCPLGHEGLECSPCNKGFYRNKSTDLFCSACPDGTVATETTSVNCISCSPGSFSNNPSEACVLCPVGTMGPFNGSSSCLPCPGGTFSDQKGSVTCTSCPAGTYRVPSDPATQCQECPLGYYSNENATQCDQCETLSKNAEFRHQNDCDQQCKKGFIRVGNDCLAPLGAIVEMCGGPELFCLVVLLIGITSSLPFATCYFCRDKDLPEELSREKSKDYVQPRASVPAGLSRGLLGDDLEEKQRHSLFSIDDLLHGQKGRKKRGQPLSLRPQELHLLLHRIDLRGSNVPGDPLRINYRDAPIHVGVNMEIFEKFCSEFNEAVRWRKWERRLLITLHALYLPLGLFILARFQKKKILTAKICAANCNHSFFRNYHLRMMSDSMRFGHTVNNDCAWIDIVAPSETTKLEISDGYHELPLVIVCAGGGTYLSPYHLDMRDTLVKFLLKFFGESGGIYIAELNSHLRTVHRGCACNSYTGIGDWW